MAYDPTVWTNGAAPPLDKAHLDKIEKGIQDAHALAAAGGGGTQYELPLSSFSGVDDDAKLGAFMSYAAAQSYKGLTVVLDEARQYTFSTKRPLYSGFSIRGAIRPTDQLRSAASTSNKVRIRTAGGLFYLDQSSTFSCAFQGLSIDGTSSTRLLDGHSSNVLWTSGFRDITSVNAANVLGSSAQRLAMTACYADGFWNVNNVQERALSIAGSDNRLDFTEFLLDSPGDAGQFPNAAYLAGFEYLSKSHLRNFYCTAEGDHSAFLISGTGDFVTFTDCSIEGRNANSPCNNALIKVIGNTAVTLRDTWLGYAMADPGSPDGGFVHATNGSVLMDGCVVEQANGVADDMPILYATGGKHIVRNMRPVGLGTKPTVRQTVAGLIDADSSVNVVTG